MFVDNKFVFSVLHIDCPSAYVSAQWVMENIQATVKEVWICTDMFWIVDDIFHVFVLERLFNRNSGNINVHFAWSISLQSEFIAVQSLSGPSSGMPFKTLRNTALRTISYPFIPITRTITIQKSRSNWWYYSFTAVPRAIEKDFKSREVKLDLQIVKTLE